jgi:NTE family protein
MEISLALGGGGVKGYSHIGVLHYMERCGVKIRAIAGTSAGGLFGTIYASGYPFEDIQLMIEKLDQTKLYNRLPGDGPSLMGLGGVIEVLEELLGDRTFDDLRIPLAMTAVDLETGQSVVLSEGRLVDAILATIALPGIFPPREYEGRLLVDGGVVDPVPVSTARALAPEVPVGAVVLSPKATSWNGHKEPPAFLSSLPLVHRLYKYRLPQSLSIFMRSVDIASSQLTNMRLKIDKPDVIIRPEVSTVGLIDSVDIEEVVKLGEEAAASVLPKIEYMFARKNQWSYRISDSISWFGDFLKKNTIDS